MSSTLAGRLFTTGTAREALVLDFVCKYQIMVKRVLPPLHLQHFSELLDEFSQNVLGQLLNDPFLSEKSVSMEVEPSPTSPAPLIQAEHSYSLCEEPRAQSPFTHITASDSFNDGKPRVGEAAGTLAPLTLTSLRVRSVRYSLISTPFSHIPAVCGLCLGPGEMQRGTECSSTCDCVLWEFARTEWY